MSAEARDVAPLIAALEGPDKASIRGAVDSLIRIARDAPQVRKQLGDLLGEPSRKNRWAVAYVLAHLDDPPASVLPALLDALDTDDPDVRWAVALLLIRLGKESNGVVDLLFELLKSGGLHQRRMAVYCLRDIGLRGASLHKLLLPLEDPDPLVRVAVLTALGAQKRTLPESVERLRKLLAADPDTRVRCAAALALARLGDPTEEVRAALIEASRAEQPTLRKAAGAALKLLNKKGLASGAKLESEDEPSVS